MKEQIRFSRKQSSKIQRSSSQIRILGKFLKDQWPIGAVVIIAVLVTLSAFAAYQAHEFGREADAKVLASINFERQLDRLLLNMTELQNASRGYLITQSPEELATYRTKKAEIQHDLAQLEALSQNRPDNQDKLARLKQLVADQLRYRENFIALVDQNGFDAGKALVEKGQGRKGMQELRAVVTSLEYREKKNLLTNQEEAEEVRETNSYFNLFAAITGVFLLGTAIFTVKIQLARSQASEEREMLNIAALNEAQELAHVGSWSWDRANDKVTWSDELYRMFGLAHGGSPPSFAAHDSIYTKESMLKLRQAVEDALQKDIPYDLELEALKSDGSLFTIRARGQSLKNLEGEIIGLAGTAQDISQEKKAIEAVLLANQRMQLAIETGGYGIWDWHVASDHLIWDDSMFGLYGCDATSFDGTSLSWRKFVHPDDLPTLLGEVESALKQGTIFFTQFRIIKPDGSERFIEGRATVIYDKEGTPSRMIGLNRDVTQEHLALLREREMTKKAQAGEQAKAEFLATMSHEIRTPLNGIMGFANLLAEETLTPLQEDYVDTIRQSGTALLRVIDDVLDFSRMDSGQFIIENTSYDPARLVAQVVKLFSGIAQKKNLLLEFSIAASIPPKIWGDEDRIRQILINLINNAIKFTESGGIRVSVFANRDDTGIEANICYQVTDSGCGIKAEIIPMIFQPFTQGDSTFSRRHGGTGLGLSIAKMLSSLMGGDIAVESQPGRGSTFTLILPLVLPMQIEEKKAIAPCVNEEFSQHYPLNILVAEDDAMNMRLIEQILKRLGYRCDKAGNGREAITHWRQNTPDLILMDLHMPELGGLEATLQIRQEEGMQKITYPVFIAACTADVIDRDRCFEAGMNAHFTKPLQIERLMEVLKEAHSHCLVGKC